MLQAKFIIVILIITILNNHTKAQNSPPENWHLLDYKQSGYYGISLNKALQLVKDKKPQEVIVAVIDSGVDTTHEDLKNILWHNTKEIPNNGIDDDHNGYTDDVYGWNYLGKTNGSSYTNDTYEYQRMYFKYKDSVAIWKNNPGDTAKLAYFKNIASVFIANNGDDDAQDTLAFKNSFTPYFEAEAAIKNHLKKQIITLSDLKKLEKNKKLLPQVVIIKQIFTKYYARSSNRAVEEIYYNIDQNKFKWERYHIAPNDFRALGTGDNENNLNATSYGNPDVMVDRAMHGTHCSGIIAAQTDNNIGIKGIAPNVKIMMLRVVPNGDEHDKDIARAIRYAVDNGARVINMSFGKALSPNKNWIDDAVAYAKLKNVLLVHSAGNDSKDNDVVKTYPNQYKYDGNEAATNFITVGASGFNEKEGLVAYFSNYGKKSVDIFAPGVDIYSTVPIKNSYERASGTSMAGPVVAGVAALVLNYYPNMSVDNLVKTLLHSVSKPLQKVNINDKMMNFEDLCISGGIVNAYNALEYAASLR